MGRFLMRTVVVTTFLACLSRSSNDGLDQWLAIGTLAFLVGFECLGRFFELVAMRNERLQVDRSSRNQINCQVVHPRTVSERAFVSYFP